MWLGVVGQKGHFCDGLPSGYDISHEIRNAERPGALAPNNIHYLKKSVNIALIKPPLIQICETVNKMSFTWSRHISYEPTFIKHAL